MIYFYHNLAEKTAEAIKNSPDCAGVWQDLTRIQAELSLLKDAESCETAEQLDHELYQKYPCIDEMIQYANQYPRQEPYMMKAFTDCEAAVLNLQYDYYGILCHFALQKGIINEMSEFIQSVK